uniref:Uncharacterized protein n=1 Tax=Chenopodium quinoa TaxID=63459 RepID=A0A803MPC8_CHEQI
MAGGGSTSSNPPKQRKRVEAESPDAESSPSATLSLKRAKDGSAFSCCEECNSSVSVALIDMHNCSIEAKIKMSLAATVVEKSAELRRSQLRGLILSLNQTRKESRSSSRQTADKAANNISRTTTSKRTTTPTEAYNSRNQQRPLFDRVFIDAVLSEWQKTLLELPTGIRQACEPDAISLAQLVKYLLNEARPSITRALQRGLRKDMSREFLGRIMADPSFLHKLLFEQFVTIACSVGQN